MKYNQTGSTFDFVFNGHGLNAGEDYTLIYYPDPWPGNGLMCLGSSTLADVYGNVSVEAAIETNTDLPAVYDDNYPDGAKIWLVKSGDVDCEAKKMIGWNPEKYLFEYDLIKFDDTDVTLGSTVEKLNLYQKDSSWKIVDGGAFGILFYNPAAPTFNFGFHAEKLLFSTSYSLIYYADGGPAGKLISKGTSNSVGSLNLADAVNLNMDLPVSGDTNSPRAKIWLVKSNEFNEGTGYLNSWNFAANKWLFENNLINYNDTDVP